ncbi:MAG: L,D-transpeptidase family protein [Rhodomicrobium sp.]
MRIVVRFALLAPVLLALGGCFSFLGFGGGEDSVPPAERQLSASTQALLAIKGMRQESPIFVRIFKEESEFEVWKWKDGRFQHFRTYPICAWSGGLGPKVQQGDRQAPEGFYTVSRGQMNPHSLYHLAFNIGFPNAYDQANGHSGSALMVHGDCKSAGCYAMTDAYIEEIYILAREAFNAGQTRFHVQALPFHLTADNMQRHRDSPWYRFWLKLKEGSDAFEATGKPPVIKVCSKQYLVNVSFPGQADPGPADPCPAYAKIDPATIQTIDGVPPTVLASLSKSEPARGGAHAQQPVAMAASMQAAPAAAQAAPLVDMSASPVISRPAPRPAEIASAQTPKAPAAPVYTASDTPYIAPTVQARAAGSAAQPVSYQAGSAKAAPAPAAPSAFTAAVVPAEQADPNALQKTNRSGKGGKLPAGSDQQASASPAGDAQPAGAQQ